MIRDAPDADSRPRRPDDTVTTMDVVRLGIGPLTPAEVVAVARDGVRVEVTDECLDAVGATRRHL